MTSSPKAGQYVEQPPVGRASSLFREDRPVCATPPRVRGQVLVEVTPGGRVVPATNVAIEIESEQQAEAGQPPMEQGRSAKSLSAAQEVNDPAPKDEWKTLRVCSHFIIWSNFKVNYWKLG